METISLPFSAKKTILAFGADMKGGVALACGKKAQYAADFGDLGEADHYLKYRSAIETLLKNKKNSPHIFAYDLHPGYLSTRLAEGLRLIYPKTALFGIQHHEAHIASACLDHRIDVPVIGVAFDGTGYGSDGAMWGGEFFVGTPRKFERVAHMRYVPMLGGEEAIRKPWRMAVSYLYAAMGARAFKLPLPCVEGTKGNKRPAIVRMLTGTVRMPLTSSIGRFFDAVGCIVLERDAITREAELPMELERIARQERHDQYTFDTKRSRGGIVIDSSPMIKQIVEEYLAHTDPGVISAKLHNTVAAIVVETCVTLRASKRVKTVLLSGGVFQNRFLVSRVQELAKAVKLDVRVHVRTPTNDEGIALGQIMIAQARVK